MTWTQQINWIRRAQKDRRRSKPVSCATALALLRVMRYPAELGASCPVQKAQPPPISSPSSLLTLHHFNFILPKNKRSRQSLHSLPALRTHTLRMLCWQIQCCIFPAIPSKCPVGQGQSSAREQRGALAPASPTAPPWPHTAQMMKAGSCSAPGAMLPHSFSLAAPRLTVLQPTVPLSRAVTSKVEFCHHSAEHPFFCYFSWIKNI